MKMHAQPHRFKTWVKETPTVSRWVNKLWNIHMMDSGCFLSSFLRINKLQLDTGKWMTLINIILREKSQTLRSTYCTVWLHFYNYKPDQTNLWCLVRTLLHPWEWSQLCLKEDNKRVGGCCSIFDLGCGYMNAQFVKIHWAIHWKLCVVYYASIK